MNGFLNINKPKGMTSSQVVSKVRFILGRNIKVGHMGTLDPIASGVLPIAIGRATRLFDYLLTKVKTYIATFQFGYSTDTLDNTGKILDNTSKIPTAEDIVFEIKKMIGEQEQIPPQFSAKSVNGVRAYDIARKGGSVILKPSKINIFEFYLLKQIDDVTFSFCITCSSGTYIRSICRDLGIALGSLATMTDLKRTKSGIFDIKDSIDLSEININNILPIDFVLKNLPIIDLDKKDIQLLLDGKKKLLKLDMVDGKYRVYSDGKLQCISNLIKGCFDKIVWLK